MDLGLYARVLWRFRIIVAVGVTLAVALAFLSFVRVSLTGSSHFSYRQAETWTSQETLLITAGDVPWTRVNGGANLAGLAAFYATLASGDAVHQRLVRRGPANGTLTVQPGVDKVTTLRAPLPFLMFTGTATHPSDAISIAQRGAAAFRSYIASLQNGARVPGGQRVRFEVLSTARTATILQGRKVTLPIVILLTILVATVALAFILENLRPRVQVVESPEDSSLRSDLKSA